MRPLAVQLWSPVQRWISFSPIRSCAVTDAPVPCVMNMERFVSGAKTDRKSRPRADTHVHNWQGQNCDRKLKYAERSGMTNARKLKCAVSQGESEEREREKSATPCAEDLDVVSVRVFQSLCCCRSSTAVPELGTHPTIKRVVPSFSQALSRSVRVQWTKTSDTPLRHTPSGLEHRPPYPGLGVAKRQPSTRQTKSRSHDSSHHPEPCCASGKPFESPPAGQEPLHVRNWEPCMVLSFFATRLMASPVKQLAGVNDQGVFFCVL